MKRILFFSVFAFVTAMNLLAVSNISAQEPEKFALLVGVNDYDDSRNFPALEFAEADADALAVKLIDCGFKKDNVFVLKCGGGRRQQPDKKNILQTLERISKLTRRIDYLLVSFAGHGVNLPNPKGGEKEPYQSYFCPPEAEIINLPTTALNIKDELYPELNKILTAHKLLFIDACRGELSRAAGDVVKAIQIVEPPKNSGIVLFQSCSDGEESYENKDLGHGYFTYFILEGLSGKAVAADGIITDMNLCSYVTRQTWAYSKNRQKPRISFPQSEQLTPTDWIKVTASERGEISLQNRSNMTTEEKASLQEIQKANEQYGKTYLDADLEKRNELLRKHYPIIRKYAEQDDAMAQYNLGECYYEGAGVSQNKAEAVKWYRKAAEQGMADAQRSLGVCYYEGAGVSENEAEAVKWYRKAAEQGDANAQFMLGLCYTEGISQDNAEAVKWFRKAAEQGNAAAQLQLSVHYIADVGVSQNTAEALKWYRKLAENPNASEFWKKWAKDQLKLLEE